MNMQAIPEDINHDHNLARNEGYVNQGLTVEAETYQEILLLPKQDKQVDHIIGNTLTVHQSEARQEFVLPDIQLDQHPYFVRLQNFVVQTPNPDNQKNPTRLKTKTKACTTTSNANAEDSVEEITLDDEDCEFTQRRKKCQPKRKLNKLPQTSHRDPLPVNTEERTISIPINGIPVQIKRFFFASSLCRVCLLVKEKVLSIFDDSALDSEVTNENLKGGPNSSKRYNMNVALETLLNISVKADDGLPLVICVDCVDSLMNFSNFRKRIDSGQSKLNEILKQVKNSMHPTVIPSIGENADTEVLCKHSSFIINAKKLLSTSIHCYLVIRNIPDKIWETMFEFLSAMPGFKSSKMNELEQYVVEYPFVRAWHCQTCQTTIHGQREVYLQHCWDTHHIKMEDVCFPCDICGKRLFKGDFSTSGDSYYEHWIQHFFFHECDVCSKKLPSGRSVWIHTRASHMNGESKQFECEVCHRKFGRKHHFITHRSTHLHPSERQQLLTNCPYCGKSLKGNLNLHIATVHTNEKRWKCLDCPKSFKRKESLTLHTGNTHSLDKKGETPKSTTSGYPCSQCGVLFKSTSTRKQHEFRHKGEKPFTCDQCPLSFFTSSALKSHHISHSENRQFTCSICSKSFKRQMYLTDHMRIHSDEKPFECSICKRRIRNRANYYKHLQVHKKHSSAKDITQDQTSK